MIEKQLNVRLMISSNILFMDNSVYTCDNCPHPNIMCCHNCPNEHLDDEEWFNKYIKK